MKELAADMDAETEFRRRLECVPVPDEMRDLPRDRRGYPIPAIVFRDAGGTPHFTINDAGMSLRALEEDRCPICWGRLTRGRWFVGGPLSALHERGAFGDPPGHRACIGYALQICPYLAAPSYAKRIDDRGLVRRSGLAVAMDPTVVPERPALFVAVMAIGQSVRKGATISIRPKKPYRAIEYWRRGRRLPDDEGAAIAATILGEPLPQPGAPRILRP
ncbi:hypothetical protein PQI07_28145 [Methylobacterium sp. 092160098-2]|uniref:hypothetical protein n=1 Tax=Methylobacterium sp. 092160098-2 TaxID=3025129 RepID=UPI002381B8C8|nr:hypothetical protein [Methylobacterium sp. 092160098-2]MDE4914541.1 hypothetical protein [Methylobacterium sp. 092160098-2]